MYTLFSEKRKHRFNCAGCRLCLCICLRMYIYIYTHTYTHYVYIYIYIHKCIYNYIYIYILYTYIYIYIYIYTYIYIHIYTHIIMVYFYTVLLSIRIRSATTENLLSLYPTTWRILLLIFVRLVFILRISWGGVPSGNPYLAVVITIAGSRMSP